MTTELYYLFLTAVLTVLLWVPYILNQIAVRGLSNAVGYPENPAPLSPWAARLKAAHYNAVEGLVVFAILVLVAHAAGVSDAATQMSVKVYFWARVAHAPLYAIGIPWGRTLSFAVGFLAQLCIAWQIFSA